MEIGSEFWEKCFPDLFIKKEKQNIAYLLSGRTALDYIIKDIKATQTFRKAMLPSYCCESMIEPFIRNDVEVQFYTVTQDEIDYPENDAEVILLIDYFGYGNSVNRKLAMMEQKHGKMVIYDATHKLNEWEFPADYVFCSYRKWLYCNFAVVWKKRGKFIARHLNDINRTYIDLRNQAAMYKARYISGEVVDKSKYMKLFAKAELLLEKDYVGYAGKPMCLDTRELIENRRKNAQYLMSKLKGAKNFLLWRSKISDTDAPLFVPILVKKGYRDRLRNYLITHQIYCPVHWPVSEYHCGVAKDGRIIYEEELSLICDQRYSIADMKREVKAIKEFYGEI